MQSETLWILNVEQTLPRIVNLLLAFKPFDRRGSDHGIASVFAGTATARTADATSLTAIHT